MSRAVHFLAAAVVVTSLMGGARAEGPSKANLDKKIANFTLKDGSDKPFTLHEEKDRKAIVAVFLSFECPMSTDYVPVLNELAKQYTAKGVSFIGICPCGESAAQVAKQAQEYKVAFPVYKDTQFKATEALQADVTPEVFVLDAGFVLRYRGRIDNGYYARLKKNFQVTKHHLKDAVEAVVAGKPVGEPATEALGCAIVREARKPAAGAVTYHKDVLPILQGQCQGCHRPGEVAPFSLMTYKQAAQWADDIKTYTQSRQMPPWKPTDGAAFRDERRLSDKEIATLAAWVDAACPEGDVKDAPPPRKFVEGWQLGKPDLVVTPESEFTLGGNGRDLFRCFVVPTNLAEDKYVTAIEFRPGNNRVVHHSLIFIDTQGRGRKLEEAQKDKDKGKEVDVGPGYNVSMGVGFTPSGGLGGWAPGQVPRQLPADTGYFLPKGSDVVVQVHYHRDGRVEKDKFQIGLYFAKQPLAKRYGGAVIPGRFLFIPAGNENFKVNGVITLEQDVDLHSVMPHMHMLGKQIKVSLTPPGGQRQTLVEVKDWDYNWQETYFLKEPMRLKTGTKFEVEAVFDNSAKNPRNPSNPPRIVTFGEQTTNEMCFVFLGATSDTPGRIRVRGGN